MNLADAPTTWADPPSTSTLEALLIFVGIPLLSAGVIALIVMAPSLAKGPRYRPSQDWSAESEWFGAPSGETYAVGAPGSGQTELEPAETTSETGGASARW